MDGFQGNGQHMTKEKSPLADQKNQNRADPNSIITEITDGQNLPKLEKAEPLTVNVPQINSINISSRKKPEQILPLTKTLQTSGLGIQKLSGGSLQPIQQTPQSSPSGNNFQATLNILQEIRNRQGAGILVDVGHSCSHVIPFFDNQVLSNSIRRADVGGKLISKFLMESVSLTQFNLNKHFFLVTDMKEKCCQTLGSPDEFLDMRQKPSLSRLSRVFYALNDYEICQKGGVVANPTAEQLKLAKNLRNLVSLQLERVIFPEILFQPSVYYLFTLIIFRNIKSNSTNK
jgi:hypothetical protein